MKSIIKVQNNHKAMNNVKGVGKTVGVVIIA